MDLSSISQSAEKALAISDVFFEAYTLTIALEIVAWALKNAEDIIQQESKSSKHFLIV